MEIRKQNVDSSEIIRRINEEAGRAFLRENLSVCAACRFQRAHRGRSNRDDPMRVANLARSLWRNREALRVHAMLGDLFRAHQQKCPRAHMQRHECVLNFTQNFRGEMKTGRGSGNRARRMSKNSLVARRIPFIAVPGDIRRQRHGTAGIKIDIFVQCHDALAIGCDLLNPQSDLGDLCCCANTHFASRPHQTLPMFRAEPFEKQKFNRAVVRESARWKHPRVV